MTVNPLHPSVAGRVAVPALPGPAAPQRPGCVLTDTRAARMAERACCCSARPAVIVLVPPSPGRPHQTDLLLCGHHYRASRQGLGAAGAVTSTASGWPVAPGQRPAPARDGRGWRHAARDQAADLLLIPDGGLVPGFACERCGALTLAGSDCPDWGTAARPVPDLLEEMAAQVLDDGGQVIAVRAPLTVAARLRYPIATGATLTS